MIAPRGGNDNGPVWATTQRLLKTCDRHLRIEGRLVAPLGSTPHTAESQIWDERRLPLIFRHLHDIRKHPVFPDDVEDGTVVTREANEADGALCFLKRGFHQQFRGLRHASK